MMITLEEQEQEVMGAISVISSVSRDLGPSMLLEDLESHYNK